LELGEKMSEYTSIVLKIIMIFVLLFGLVAIVGTAYAIDKEFRKCAGCHKIDEGKKGGMGPNLYGIFNSPAGQVEKYRYSEWLKESGIVWTRESLHAWLSDRKTREEYFGKDVFKTKMMWTGIKKEEQMKEILDYLESKELVH
jgi:cytochrome c